MPRRARARQPLDSGNWRWGVTHAINSAKRSRAICGEIGFRFAMTGAPRVRRRAGLTAVHGHLNSLSLWWLIEISKIRRPLPFLCRHDHSLGAEEIRLALDADMIVIFHAVVLDPPRTRVATAAIALGHNPRARQGMVEDGDLVADDIRIVLVESIALLDDRLIVGMQR